MSEAAYLITIDPAAKRELDKVKADVADKLTERISEASERRQPTSHPKVKHLSGGDGLFRVRAEGYRAICQLEKPELQVLLVGKRRTVYDRLHVAKRRAKNGGAS